MNHSSPQDDLPKLIRRARCQAGLGRRELAERLGVREHTLALWEDPKFEGVDLAILRRVARATGRRLEVRFAAPEVRVAPAWKSLLADAG